MTTPGLLLSVTSRPKSRNAPSRPESLKVLAIVVAKALLPDPARPWIHNIFCSLLASFAQSATNSNISVLVLGRHSVRLEASILTGSSFSRMSRPSVYPSARVLCSVRSDHWSLTEYNLVLSNMDIIERGVSGITVTGIREGHHKMIGKMKLCV